VDSEDFAVPCGSGFESLAEYQQYFTHVK